MRTAAWVLAGLLAGCIGPTPETTSPVCAFLPFAQIEYDTDLDPDRLIDRFAFHDIAARRTGYAGENVTFEFGASWPPQSHLILGRVVPYTDAGRFGTLVDLVYRGDGTRYLPPLAAAEILRPFAEAVSSIVNETLENPSTMGAGTILFDTRNVCT